MSVTLTPEVEDRIRHWMDSGQYPDAGSLILKALEALEAQEEARFLKLREPILVGHSSGPGEELTDELWERIEREADEADRLGLPIRDEVQP
jgi:putative addiction module CopG family antidote